MRKVTVGLAIAAAVTLGTVGCSGDGLAAGKPAAAQSSPDIQMSAMPTEFVPSILHDGSPATAVMIEVKNISADKTVKVNPLYFSVTDTDGVKHKVGLGDAENQIGAEELQPDEIVKGVVVADGEFTPAKVVFSPPLGSSLVVEVVPAQ